MPRNRTRTIDVLELDRAVADPVDGDRSPTGAELLAALDTDEERELVPVAQASSLQIRRERRPATPVS